VWKKAGMTFDVLFRVFLWMKRGKWPKKTGVYRPILESGTSRGKKICNSARPWHAVTTSVADQRTVLHSNLLTIFSIKLAAAW